MGQPPASCQYPQLGRFTQPDTIVPNTGDPQALNRYSYVLNNALKYTDPSGHAYDAGGGDVTSCSNGSASFMACTYPESHPLAGYWIGTTQAEADAGFAAVTTAGEIAIGVLFEPADWVFTANHWRQGDFHVLDLAGLLPFVPASGVRALRHADEIEGIARRLDKDLFAFGNRARPRPPRVGIDVSPNVDGILSPQTLPFPEGAST